MVTVDYDQGETIAYVIRKVGCSFREAYAACCMNNYSRERAIQELQKHYAKKRNLLK